jgi:hypothetical protein
MLNFRPFDYASPSSGLADRPLYQCRQALPIIQPWPYTLAMRLLTIFFLTLLIFALPLQGIAAVAQFETACPVKATEQPVQDADDQHGCCHDADTTAKTGAHCKSQQNCQAGALGLNYAARPIYAGSGRSPKPLFFTPSQPTNNPSATWRPPNPARFLLARPALRLSHLMR